MKFFKQLLVSAMLLGATVGAQAADYNLGALVEGFNDFGPNAVTGSFLDKINFTLGGSSNTDIGVGALNFTVHGTPRLNIDGLSVALFDSGNHSLGGGLDFTVGGLNVGNYYLQVTGIANGSNGGAYAGSINVTAVPEPDIWRSLMGGLVVIGFLAYRRREETY